MCGICGIFNVTGSQLITTEMINGMLEAIKHRGPDGSQVKLLSGVGLGFNRLSFLDLKGGMQPLSNEDGSLHMVCNGEIFNYRELKNELIGKGHTFRTGTDVEVILHLYEEHGNEFPKLLNGQFAIALYDSRVDELTLVRDQIGIAPLFYTESNGRVIFASEIKGILECPDVERRLNLLRQDICSR